MIDQLIDFQSVKSIDQWNWLRILWIDRLRKTEPHTAWLIYWLIENWMIDRLTKTNGLIEQLSNWANLNWLTDLITDRLNWVIISAIHDLI